MDREAIEQLLQRSIQDGRLSRSERAVLRTFLHEDATQPHERDWVRSRALAVAKSQLITPVGASTIGWLEDVIGLLLTTERSTQADHAAAVGEVHFSPGDACLLRIQQLIRQCRSNLDICVFTITDDRIARSILDAHARRVRMRIISDDDKAGDLGSDLARIRAAGVPTATDRTPDHMHHKFAIFDKQLIVSGSYNWTRSAAERNEENVIVTGDRRIVNRFQDQFDKLWADFSR